MTKKHFKVIADIIKLHASSPAARIMALEFANGWDDVRNNEVEYEVVGSRGNKYRVRCDSKGIWSCTCAGFGFRRKCRHIAEKVKLSS